MLWYKAWLETRWRMLLPMGMIVLVLMQVRSQGIGPRDTDPLLNVFTIFWAIAPISLAGAGIKTESTFGPMKGLHGSIHYTLSLPVSRLRLFAVRASVGMLETLVVIVSVCFVAAIAVPGLRTLVALPDAIRYALTIFLCGSVFYGLSVLLSTFLDQIWQVWGSMLAVFLLRWGFSAAGEAHPFNIVRAMGTGSPLITHTLPLTAIAVSLTAAAIFFTAAAKVIQAQEH